MHPSIFKCSDQGTESIDDRFRLEEAPRQRKNVRSSINLSKGGSSSPVHTENVLLSRNEALHRGTHPGMAYIVLFPISARSIRGRGQSHWALKHKRRRGSSINNPFHPPPLLTNHPTQQLDADSHSIPTNMTLETDIAALKSTPGFAGDIIPKGHPDYAKAIARWSLTSERDAKVVVYPKNEESVSVTIKWAISRKYPLAVKGGGHSQSGASSIEDGVVIDLERHLGGVNVDPYSRRAFIGGGAIWQTVNDEAIKWRLATVCITLLYIFSHR